MSLYSECMAERYGYQVFEQENGFITYKICGDLCTAIEIFVSREHRGNGVWKDLWSGLKQRAKEEGASRIVGFVDLSKEDPARRLIAYIRYGAEIKDAQNEIIIVEWSI